MTPEERSILSDFLKDLDRFRGTAKDAEAAALIDSAVRRNPDAAYVLVQHAILANRGLQNATARIQELEGQLRGNSSQSSFLGGSPLLDRPSGPWGSVPPASGGYAPSPSAAPQTFAASRPGGGVGSFLGNIATTAAGVAGGALLFEGISGLLGGNRGLWGGDAPVFVERDSSVPAQADFSSVDDQMGNSDPDVADYGGDGGGDFGSFDDSIG
jgi:uncharacterized protein